jgi:hypothetical protein
MLYGNAMMPYGIETIPYGSIAIPYGNNSIFGGLGVKSYRLEGKLIDYCQCIYNKEWEKEGVYLWP